MLAMATEGRGRITETEERGPRGLGMVGCGAQRRWAAQYGFQGSGGPWLTCSRAGESPRGSRASLPLSPDWLPVPSLPASREHSLTQTRATRQQALTTASEEGVNTPFRGVHRRSGLSKVVPLGWVWAVAATLCAALPHPRALLLGGGARPLPSALEALLVSPLQPGLP